MFWKSDIDLTVVESSPNFIDAVFNHGKENSWRFTSFYGALETHNHHLSWNILRHLLQKSSLPWLCARDFNEITRSYEKADGRLRPYRQMQDFCDIIDKCGFVDLGFVGNKFT